MYNQNYNGHGSGISTFNQRSQTYGNDSSSSFQSKPTTFLEKTCVVVIDVCCVGVGGGGGGGGGRVDLTYILLSLIISRKAVVL